MNLRMWIVMMMIAAAALFGAAVGAGDNESDQVLTAEKDGREEHFGGYHPAPEPLGKTVKLIFRIKEGDEDNKFSVFTATTRFSIDVTYSGEEATDFVGVIGHVRLLDDRGKRLLVTATYEQRHDGPSETFDTAADCSTIVALGREAELLETDAYTLTVEAEEVKDTD